MESETLNTVLVAGLVIYYLAREAHKTYRRLPRRPPTPEPTQPTMDMRTVYRQ
jgi:hypothetical protein